MNNYPLDNPTVYDVCWLCDVLCAFKRDNPHPEG